MLPRLTKTCVLSVVVFSLFNAQPSDAQFHHPALQTREPANQQAVRGRVLWIVHLHGQRRREPVPVHFYIDDNLRWTQYRSPYRFNGRNGVLDTGTLSAGTHRLLAKAKLPHRIVKTAITITVRSDSVAANPNAADPNLLFTGRKISDFWLNQSAPGAVTEVPDPASSGRTVFQMSVNNADVYPITPTDNPRAQLCSPLFIHPEDEFWWSSSVYFPADFPVIPDSSWLAVEEGPYGYPFDGSPPVSISVAGDSLEFQRDDIYDWDIPWSMPLPRNQWVSILWHIRFGRDGFVELWINGNPITFFADSPFNPDNAQPTQHLQMQTEDHTNDGNGNDDAPNFLVIQNYRQANMFQNITLYHGPTFAGTTRASVGS